MGYKLKRQLKRLENKELIEDIKKFINTSHSFYEEKIPELKTLAKRLHEEHTLKKFYKIFNKLWNSGYQGEKSLAIYALQLYKNDFDLNTFKFFKPKFKDIKSWDQAQIIGRDIIGNILLNYPKLDKEILKLEKSNNLWIKKIALYSTFPIIKKKQQTKLALYICNNYLNISENNIQEAIGETIKEISNYKPEIAKKFILKHIKMNFKTFEIATENLLELRNMRKIKKLEKNTNGWFFWKSKIKS